MNQKLTRQALEHLEVTHPSQVVITRTGRWWYRVELTHRADVVCAWPVLGGWRAQKVADRKLGRYERKLARINGFGRQVIR